MNSAQVQALARRLRAAELKNSQEHREIFEGIREIRIEIGDRIVTAKLLR